MCQVKSILFLSYCQGNQKPPLFAYEDGSSLTCLHFSSVLDSHLKQVYINKDYYNTHSFWIGATTTARQTNESETSIKMMGTQKNDAYQSYIRTSKQELAKVSKYLVSGYSWYMLLMRLTQSSNFYYCCTITFLFIV